ncbi:DUF6924 domain-containing protein [Marinitenerispora sediminis]|uniref:DUF6924 domain-containing protein n=1 Tax=Marinitenerispora sediminis TaxID=1931232 RepID=UPI0015F13B7C|nr:hypothetical protein [Marinitenerispora sediminis]
MTAARPPLAHRGRSALVVRTDHGDDRAWQAVARALAEPWDDVGREPDARVVDDPAWDGATADEVLEALRARDDLAVVFLADSTTMRSEHRPLLAVTTARAEGEDDEDYEQLTEFGREFRTLPAGVHEIQVNLAIANTGFDEYAAAAHDDPESVYRPSWLQPGSRARRSAAPGSPSSGPQDGRGS